jgi:hypothetical protein
VRRFSFYFMPLLVFVCFVSLDAVEVFAQKPLLELLDAKATASATAINIVGQVKNISSSDIRGVTVYCDFQGAGGKVMRTEETKLDIDPLAPDKTTEFKCSTKAGADIKGYSFRFDRLFGGPILPKDSRKK